MRPGLSVSSAPRFLLLLALAATTAFTAGSPNRVAAADPPITSQVESAPPLRATVIPRLSTDSGIVRRRGRETYDISFGEFPSSSRLTLDVRAVCAVVDDGTGQGVVRPLSARVVWPNGVRRPQRVTLCREDASPPTVIGTGRWSIKHVHAPVPMPPRRGQARSGRWTVTFSDPPATARTGVMVRRWSAFTPGRSRTIWSSDFDDYINICVNDGLRIRAAGGRLYCTTYEAPSSNVTVRLRPVRR